MKLKVVHVIWADSETAHGWESLEEKSNALLLVHTVGVLLKDEPDYVMIAHSCDPENNNTNGRIVIPQSAIKKIKTICQINTK